MARMNWKRVSDETRMWKQGTETIGVARDAIQRETSGEPCGICLTGEAVLRTGPHGRFMGCSRYPRCSGTCKVSGSGEIVGEWQGRFDPTILSDFTARRLQKTAKPSVRAWLEAVRLSKSHCA
jgi:ssDNA-binding Zn-finger/Zn-ribbon topoisomerase 1